jgi:hypothetical protein
MNRSAIRKEAHLKRASLALDLALRLTTDRRLVRKLARLVLHLGSTPLTTQDSEAPMTREAIAALLP